MLLAKFMIPPTVPVPPLGAINEGSDQPTGAAAASPVRASEIQATATTGRVVVVAPNTARPTNIPTRNTVLRTRVSSRPPATRRSTSQPPTTRSDTEAQAHGIAA